MSLEGRYRQFNELETCRSTALSAVWLLSAALPPLNRRSVADSKGRKHAIKTTERKTPWRSAYPQSSKEQHQNPHFTEINSTSNTSVAFGPILPPAPVVP